MKTQRQCLALHLGEWHGLFCEYRPTAHGWELVGQKRSLITFEALDLGGIRQTNAYYPPQGSPTPESRQSWVYEDFSPGLRFFPDGSFSNGRLQLAPFGDFAVEQGFLWGDRKARLVQQWDPQGRLVGVTVILERRGQALDLAADFPSLTKAQLGLALQGRWRGIAQSFSAVDSLPSETEVQFWGEEETGIRAPLPGGLWMGGPDPLPIPTLHRDRRFSVSLGWFPEGPEGRHLLRLVRDYDEGGAWQRVTLTRLERDPG
ncbi:DUF3598 family protein [Synechococcus sp. OH20]|uniref:DUF3598 family protein n=1 Tax=Synechococcus sp. OH20 TaxID=139337 RepID=UPI0039C69F39